MGEQGHERGRRRADDSKWKVDKHIPVALIFTMLFQSAIIVWWAASITSRVDTLERLQLTATDTFQRVIRVEEKITAIKEIMDRRENGRVQKP